MGMREVMKGETIKLLERYFEGHPKDRGTYTPINPQEVEQELCVEFPGLSEAYLEFVRMFGGASIGIYDIYGLRKAENMGNDFGGVVELTKHFRDQNWPGSFRVVIFSFDQGGNPIGLSQDGRVWVHDADFCSSYCIAEDFEEFLRSYALEKEKREVEYLEIEQWE